MTVFYSLLGVSLFVPVLGALFVPRAGTPEALAAIAAGVATLVVVRFDVFGRLAGLDPTLSGLVAGAVAFTAVLIIRRPS